MKVNENLLLANPEEYDIKDFIKFIQHTQGKTNRISTILVIKWIQCIQITFGLVFKEKNIIKLMEPKMEP